MENLGRSIIFIFGWIVIFFTSLPIAMENEEHFLLQYFVGFVFLGISFLLVVSIYLIHQSISNRNNLQEILFVMLIVSLCTSASSFFGYF